ncbi:MAG TPA: ComEA family DNA-binding protein [Pseudomonadota bacterium]|jgi:competence protein ComEA|nr:ComEA family DNA-binding protein [Pseudomonadota bacterium]
MNIRKLLLPLALAACTFSASPKVHAESAARPVAEMAAPKSTGVVNINDATAEQLERLPGVGPSRAQAIIQFRKTHGFKRVEDLQRIKGLGKKTWNRLRPMVTLSGPTTLT